MEETWQIQQQIHQIWIIWTRQTQQIQQKLTGKDKL